MAVVLQAGVRQLARLPASGSVPRSAWPPGIFYIPSYTPLTLPDSSHEAGEGSGVGGARRGARRGREPRPPAEWEWPRHCHRWVAPAGVPHGLVRRVHTPVLREVLMPPHGNPQARRRSSPWTSRALARGGVGYRAGGRARAVRIGPCLVPSHPAPAAALAPAAPTPTLITPPLAPHRYFVVQTENGGKVLVQPEDASQLDDIQSGDDVRVTGDWYLPPTAQGNGPPDGIPPGLAKPNGVGNGLAALADDEQFGCMTTSECMRRAAVVKSKGRARSVPEATCERGPRAGPLPSAWSRLDASARREPRAALTPAPPSGPPTDTFVDLPTDFPVSGPAVSNTPYTADVKTLFIPSAWCSTGLGARRAEDWRLWPPVDEGRGCQRPPLTAVSCCGLSRPPRCPPCLLRRSRADDQHRCLLPWHAGASAYKGSDPGKGALQAL